MSESSDSTILKSATITLGDLAKAIGDLPDEDRAKFAQVLAFDGKQHEALDVKALVVQAARVGETEPADAKVIYIRAVPRG